MNSIRTAEIIAVGTELLIGDIVNTNAAYLAKKLASVGVSVYHQSVVGDNPKRLEEELSLALSRSDLVLLSGGLGPTYDDLTKETVAAHFGREMHLDTPSLEAMERYFLAKYGNLDRMTPNNRKQAMIPDGAVVLENPNGTAPGVLLEADGKAVALLPGPPREFEPMVDASILPYVATRSNRVFFSRNISIIGMGESQVESILFDLMKHSLNPTVAPYAKDGEVRLRVTASAENAETAASMCDEVVKKIQNTPVGEYIVGIDMVSLEDALVSLLREKRLTVTAAESCTGGMVASRITDVPGASEVLKGSFVTYSNEVKISLLGVSPASIAAETEVSAAVAMQMAQGARKALGADVGISTTGYAGPTGGTPENPVGTVYIGISTKNGEFCERLSLSSMRSRNLVRKVASTRALLAALKAIR